VIYLGIFVLVIAVLLVALYRRGQQGTRSIGDDDYQRRAYGDGAADMPPPQSDANRFGGGTDSAGGTL
jgi:hypothetical protein